MEVETAPVVPAAAEEEVKAAKANPAETPEEEEEEEHTKKDEQEKDMEAKDEAATSSAAAAAGTLSPLTGAYLLVVLGEPLSEEHKAKMLNKLTQGMNGAYAYMF